MNDDPMADRARFDRDVRAGLPKLRGIVRRMVGDADETDDVVQDTLVRAWNARASFRGDAVFSTWLCSIGARAAIDHLRRRKRWRAHAQIAYANACAGSGELQMEVGAAYASPDFVYEAKEHIAYCFTCVGRSLPPEQQAALVLREMLGLSGREAAAAMDVTEPVFRHSLAAARREMEATYDGLCSLVSKRGVCYQCKGLREAAPPGREGGPIPAVRSFDERLAIARGADIDDGVSQAMHDLFWRRTAEIEEAGIVPDSPDSGCGEDASP